MKFALNHMTAPRLDWRAFLDLAQSLGCVGVEFRNDLNRPLFDGEQADIVAAAARDRGLRIVGLSQVYPFNSWSDEIAAEVRALIATAQACGAETISLIPRNDGTGRGNGERQGNLRLALREILPMLKSTGMVALVEPLGFERSSLRHKAETINAIEAVGGSAHYKLVHDTFHHVLAKETEFFPEWTGIVHVSGVEDQSLSAAQMEDEHRVMVTPQDRLGNCTQIAALMAAGYDGPISVEAFSPVVHAFTDAEAPLRASFDFIRSQVSALAD
ncbi:TIM barrel protein [Antarctobacter sp.]|uniref:TIM barrel protein n=1 Tax=Antarctobacter sp. TaxID=1872577 RepID=UPI003A913E70